MSGELTAELEIYKAHCLRLEQQLKELSCERAEQFSEQSMQLTAALVQNEKLRGLIKEALLVLPEILDVRSYDRQPRRILKEGLAALAQKQAK